MPCSWCFWWRPSNELELTRQGGLYIPLCSSSGRVDFGGDDSEEILKKAVTTSRSRACIFYRVSKIAVTFNWLPVTSRRHQAHLRQFIMVPSPLLPPSPIPPSELTFSSLTGPRTRSLKSRSGNRSPQTQTQKTRPGSKLIFHGMTHHYLYYIKRLIRI